MNELDKYQLDSAAEGESPADPPLAAGEPRERASGDEPPGDRSSSPPVLAVVAVIAALALVALVYFWFFGRKPPPPEVAPAAETAPTAPRPEGRVESEPIEQEELPILDASDDVVRRLVAGLSDNPQLAAWLINEDLVRRFVVSVDNMAEGVAPRPHLGFLQPRGEFEVETRNGRQTISSDTFQRYDLATAVFTSLDTEGTIEIYRRLEPLTDQAYADLGYPNRDFGDTLKRALRVVIETPSPPSEMEVVRGVKSYEFVDPRYEDLEAVQKQLLRLGPDNLGRVQAKAAELLEALGG